MFHWYEESIKEEKDNQNDISFIMSATNSDQSTSAGRGRASAATMARIEANNPMKTAKSRSAPDMTFEITMKNYDPLGYGNINHVSDLISLAREKTDKSRIKEDRLRIFSRIVFTGDLIVWAGDRETKEWLQDYFEEPEFADRYRAELKSEQPARIKYILKVRAPNSVENPEVILASFVKRN